MKKRKTKINAYGYVIKLIVTYIYIYLLDDLLISKIVIRLFDSNWSLPVVIALSRVLGIPSFSRMLIVVWHEIASSNTCGSKLKRKH